MSASQKRGNVEQKRKDCLSECLDSETECFQTNLIHSIPHNEDVLITESSLIICVLLLTNLFCVDQWAGHHLLPEIFFSSNLPPLRVLLK